MRTCRNDLRVRKFCTLQEAAERLNATQEQIEHLVKRGILHEFRDGTHRLVKTAEVGAIVVARNRRLERQGQPRPSSMSGSPARTRDKGSAASRPAEIRLPRAATTTSQRPPHRPLSPIAGRKTRKETPMRVGQTRRPGSGRSPNLPSLSDSVRNAQRREEPETRIQPQNQSLAQWFWTGLIQDSPVTIALFSTLILLLLAALVGGVCMLVDAL